MSHPLRILVLEDEAEHFQLVQMLLARDQLACELRHVIGEADFLEALERFVPELVLADYRLPDYDGLAALAAVRQRTPEIPVIIVSGQMGEELAVEALKCGAVDYVLKTNLRRLPAAVRRAEREREQQAAYREAQRALRRAHDELEQRVKDRTAELLLANSRLHEEMEEHCRTALQVQRLSQDLAHYGRVSMAGELAAALAHELRQPLTAILSNAEAGVDLMTAPGIVSLTEVREILEDIAASGRRAGEVIRRLRSLFRKGQAELLPLDLNELVREILPLVRSQAGLHGVTLATDLAPDLPPVRGDRVQLEQVLMNLIINAIDSLQQTPVGNRRLVLRTARSALTWIEIAVEDSGLGIPDEHRERIFDSFFTTKPAGMGMGLSISRSIAEAHGGRLRAGNNLGPGATVRLQLPGDFSAGVAPPASAVPDRLVSLA